VRLARPVAGSATYTAPVSETPSKTSAETRLSLRKPAAKTGSAATTPARIPAPPTINYACAALIVIAVAAVVRGLALLGSTSQLQSFVVDANNRAKTPKSPYGPDQIAADVHSLRQGTLLMGAVIAVVLVLLTFAMRRARTASGTRWAMVIVMLFTSLPFYVIPISKFPMLPNVAGVLIGVASIAAIVLVFLLKPSQQYFRACREASLPPERRGQPRPSLFGPRRPRAGLAGPGGRAAAARAASEQTDVVRPGSAPKARAKVRADADAVARGAELARSRAKASKSRKTSG
jgi:hypothetical protein